ncbi:MAG: hypothetical protein IT168_32815, partial [Bryobacterales bacterium]|nr:hypothetical protein [Bryobacterales bacterium]
MSANLKTKSSQNARKHGLSAESIPTDLRPVFNTLRNELHAQCRPDGPLEEIFFDKLRALDFQNELYDRSDGRDPITHPATLNIQRFAKRTPPPRTSPETEPRPSASAAPSDDILTHFPPSVAAE